MSIDRRLREGLDANTMHLLPQVDHELGVVLRRAHRRHRARMVAGGLAAAAVLAGTGWLLGVDSADRSDGPPPPSDKRVRVAEPEPMAGIDGPLEPGTYAMPMWGDADTLPRALVDVPAGYFSPGGLVIDPGYDGVEPDQRGELTFYPVHDVYRDPCQRTTTHDPGPTTQDFVTAITRQPGQSTSSVEPVTVGGHRGHHVTITLPEGTNLTRCSNGSHALWRHDADVDGVVDLDSADLTTHLWALDVEGQRVVMLLNLYPGQPAGQNAEMLRIARGTRFIEPLEP